MKADNQTTAEYIAACADRVGGTSYFHDLGLSDETVQAFNLGYDPEYKRIPADEAYPAAIIPTGKEGYTAYCADQTERRDIRHHDGDDGTFLFRPEVLTATREPVYLVSRELDALILHEAGAQAIAANSTNTDYLTDAIKAVVDAGKILPPLVIALDKKATDKKTEQYITDRVRGALDEIGIRYRTETPYPAYNTALEAVRDNNAAIVRDEVNRINGAIAAEKENQRREWVSKNSVSAYIDGFINGIANYADTPFIPTGFTALDKILDGGLYEGLYSMGAISSLGKTTFALQIADQIAQRGGDVLIFSLEMARTELMSKSISRLTLMDVLQNKNSIGLAKTNRGISTGSRYENYSDAEMQVIERAIAEYRAFADHVFIHEGNGDVTAETIGAAVKKHIALTGKSPVVIVDYLQIIQSPDPRLSDKQAVDRTVFSLKTLSRACKIPIIAINSFNRQGYDEAATMASFKESGSIEYTSDVLFGLHLKGAGEKDFNADEAKKKDPREIVVSILKNRNGATGSKLEYQYYPKFNYFKEVGVMDE